MPKRS